MGRHLIKTWSSTQSLVSLSSGEAEFYGVVKAAGVGLGYQALLRDVGVHLQIRTWTDSTATMGICGRQGLGKLRHIDTQCLWVQQRVRDHSIELLKVRGEDNPADLFTKHLSSRDRIHDLLKLFGCEYRGGRADSAPRIRAGVGTSKGELLSCQTESGHTVVRRGCVYPATQWEDEAGRTELVPEAHPRRDDLLPHLHADWQARFQAAEACEPLQEIHVPEDESLEKRGVALGATGTALRTSR